MRTIVITILSVSFVLFVLTAIPTVFRDIRGRSFGVLLLDRSGRALAIVSLILALLCERIVDRM